eukprot:642209-Pelagomonas_calceolata.AAC.5
MYNWSLDLVPPKARRLGSVRRPTSGAWHRPSAKPGSADPNVTVKIRSMHQRAYKKEHAGMTIRLKCSYVDVNNQTLTCY